MSRPDAAGTGGGNADSSGADAPEPVGTRGPELAVGALLFGLGVMVVMDSLRVGTGWGDDGPRSGYFPFYIGCALLLSSGWIIVSQLMRWARDTEEFAERGQIALVVSVLVPMVVYVGLIFPLGIYVASTLLIGFFMIKHGKYRIPATAAVALGVPVFFFLVFEKWFLVPLPKGALERLFGL
jgi:hypothetical protein